MADEQHVLCLWTAGGAADHDQSYLLHSMVGYKVTQESLQGQLQGYTTSLTSWMVWWVRP